MPAKPALGSNARIQNHENVRCLSCVHSICQMRGLTTSATRPPGALGLQYFSGPAILALQYFGVPAPRGKGGYKDLGRNPSIDADTPTYPLPIS